VEGALSYEEGRGGQRGVREISGGDWLRNLEMKERSLWQTGEKELILPLEERVLGIRGIAGAVK